MLNINFEFRKGIFFLRLIGDVTKQTYASKEKELTSLIADNQFKYIVININNVKTMDLDGFNCLTKMCSSIKNNANNLIICDKSELFKTLLINNVTSIKDELEVL